MTYKMGSSPWGLTTLPAEEPPWRLRAACRGRPPDWWDLPAKDERTDETEWNNREAKRICRSCPVSGVDGECLREAVQLRELGVIRAGQELPSSSHRWPSWARKRGIRL